MSSDKSTTNSGFNRICKYTNNQEKLNFIEILVNNLIPILYDSKKIINYLNSLQINTIWEDANVRGIFKSRDVCIIGSSFSYILQTPEQNKTEQKKLLWISEAFNNIVKKSSDYLVFPNSILISYNKRKYSCLLGCL
jgi:hypothetical protein